MFQVAPLTPQLGCRVSIELVTSVTEQVANDDPSLVPENCTYIRRYSVVAVGSVTVTVSLTVQSDAALQFGKNLIFPSGRTIAPGSGAFWSLRTSVVSVSSTGATLVLFSEDRAKS